MAEGYNRADCGDCENMWLDELLCEYVDGTMDRVVRTAFDECLAVDPGLAEQVRRLRSTRSLLCRHRCRAPRDLRARVRRRLAQEMMLSSNESQPETSGGSALALFLLAGLLAGTTWFAARAASPAVEEHPVAMTPLTPPPGLPSFVDASTQATWQLNPAHAFHVADGAP